MKTISVMKAS